MTEKESAGPETTAALEFRGVGRRFGWTWALREVELRVERGEVVAVTGPNGAGKSTLLKVAATLLRPTEGEVEVLGRGPSGARDAIRRRTGFLGAEDYLYGELTARENLLFSCRMSGLSDAGDRVEGALTKVGLEEVAGRRVREFSSGMRRRLALARLHLRPVDLALLDEPFASLDAEGVARVEGLVEEIRGRGGTVLMASHRAGRWLEGCDRRVSLRRGRIESGGRVPGDGVG